MGTLTFTNNTWPRDWNIQADIGLLGGDFGEGEAHNIELFGFYDMKDNGLMLQPKLTLSADDAFDIEMGVIIFAGDEESLFGRFDKNNQVYLKCTYSF